jgi:hypothetical protein
MKYPRLYVLALILVLPAYLLVERMSSVQPNAVMVRAANDFLATLTPEQRAKAVFELADAERLNWHFIPRERRGLPFKEMTDAQRTAARRLLQAGLSQRGYMKANTIMELELVLREMGGNPNVRDPELYFFSIFGAPSTSAAWGWRTEGHHLSLNFTVAGDSVLATTPSFFGANPAHVRTGSRQGLRALAAEEDLARTLITALDAAQRAVAIIATEAPRDIITGNTGKVDPLSPVGIPSNQLRPEQSAMLVRLLDEYLNRMAPELARQRRARLERTDFGRVTFAWAGSIEAGGPHYYRVQGPTFLIEYDNTQNEANHIHSVWRDFEGDFGRDLLRDHYRSGVHPH